MSRPSPRPTFYEYLVQVVCLYPPNQRVGQWYFNALAGVRSDLADAVCGTALDPFHRNDRLPAFLAWIRENWDRDPDDPPFDGTSLKISLEQLRRGEVTDL